MTNNRDSYDCRFISEGEDWGDRSAIDLTMDGVDPDTQFKYEVKDAPEQGTDKWLEWRKQGITATEAATIMNPSNWGSPLSVYTDKLGLTPRDQSDDEGFMEWGHRIEDLLVQKFMEVHPKFKDCTQGRLYQRGWCKCSLDAQCWTEDGTPVIIECKTGQHVEKWNPIPPRYYAQVQWQMYVTGIRKAYFSVLICGHEWFEREVEFDADFVSRMLDRCFYVWDCIQLRNPPTRLSDFTSDGKAIAALAGEEGMDGEPVEFSEQEAGRYLALKEAYEKAEAEFKGFKNEIALRMVGCKSAKCDGKSFASWVERKGSTSIDKELLKKLYPEVYDAVKTEGLPTRYLRFMIKDNK